MAEAAEVALSDADTEVGPAARPRSGGVYGAGLLGPGLWLRQSGPAARAPVSHGPIPWSPARSPSLQL